MERLLLFPVLISLSLSFATETSQQCQEAGMPWDVRIVHNGRDYLLSFVYWQLSGQGAHRGKYSKMICEASTFLLSQLYLLRKTCKSQHPLSFLHENNPSSITLLINGFPIAPFLLFSSSLGLICLEMADFLLKLQKLEV